MPPGRLPDFFVIGAMKAGSTSLHMWLSEQPEIWGLPRKEPHFFSQDWVWNRGVEWYSSLFADAPAGVLAFESSTSYSDPQYAQAAQRMRAVTPEARIVYVVRHPIDRLRSDYRHSVGEARQSTPLGEAVLDPECGHVTRSLYHRCLAPFRAAFPREQLLVITFEALTRSPHAAWGAVLSHLGLSARGAPATRHNATEERAFSPGLKRFLRRSNLLRLARRAPEPLRRAVWRVARSDPSADALVATADDELPATVTQRIWADVAELEHWLEAKVPLWEPGSASAGPTPTR